MDAGNQVFWNRLIYLVNPGRASLC